MNSNEKYLWSLWLLFIAFTMAIISNVINLLQDNPTVYFVIIQISLLFVNLIFIGMILYDITKTIIKILIEDIKKAILPD